MNIDDVIAKFNRTTRSMIARGLSPETSGNLPAFSYQEVKCLNDALEAATRRHNAALTAKQLGGALSGENPLTARQLGRIYSGDKA